MISKSLEYEGRICTGKVEGVYIKIKSSMQSSEHGADTSYLMNPVVKAAGISTIFPFSSTGRSMLKTESREAPAIHTVDIPKAIPGL